MPRWRASAIWQPRSKSATILPREAVAYPGLGEDVFRLGGVGLDLFAQLVDEDAQVLGLVAVVRTPHGLQELAMGHGTAGVRHQVAQSVELLGREADVFAVGVHLASVEIDLQVRPGVAVRAAFG